MKPIPRTHSEYQTFISQQLNRSFSFDSIVPADRIYLYKLWSTDLSETDSLLMPFYSNRGPLPRTPSDMLRSYLLMILTKTVSTTKWIDQLRRVPFYAVLSGFQPGDLPGIGTFYDFFDRLWLSDSNNFLPNERRSFKKPPKGKKKGKKAPTVSKDKVAKIIKRITKQPLSFASQPFDLLFDIFKSQFVQKSYQLGLITDFFSLAGDGTPVVTSSLPRSHSLCECRSNGITDCKCKRYFQQPDCNSGWDSSREKYYNGYSLYMFTESSSFNGLPLYPRLYRASKHDSVSMVFAFEEMKQRYSEFNIRKILLDSAHDNMETYRYFLRQGITPFIDLNERAKGATVYKDDILLSPKGIPLCPKGLEMKNNGYDYSRARRKFRCPLVKKGIVTCDTPCSDSSYGRCVYTYTEDNPRWNPAISRSSEKWKQEYNRRTTVERSNKREKVDYCLEAAHHRSSKMWYCRVFAIMMCQHIDAWMPIVDFSLKEILGY